MALEADIPLKSEAPEEVVLAYNGKYKGKLAAWIKTDRSCCGCIQHNRSVCADLSDAKYVTLFEQKPAKGWGWVGITINSSKNEVITTIFESRYSEKSLKWLENTQDKLVELFKLEAQYENHGYDA